MPDKPNKGDGSESLYKGSYRAHPYPEGREFATWFDPWPLLFAEATLSGLVKQQDSGGIEVVRFELIPAEDVLVVVVDHYGDADVPRVRVGHRLVLSKLRAMGRDASDPTGSAGLYLEDLGSPWIPQGTEASDGTYWITRP